MELRSDVTKICIKSFKTEEEFGKLVKKIILIIKGTKIKQHINYEQNVIRIFFSRVSFHFFVFFSLWKLQVSAYENH